MVVLKDEKALGAGVPIKIDAQAQTGDSLAVSTMVVSKGEAVKKGGVGRKEENS